jgi:hypothetical protein
MVGLFLIVVAMPCFFVAVWGSKMINDLGNFPTKSVQIQVSASWKILLVEIVSFSLLILLFIFFYNLKTFEGQ